MIVFSCFWGCFVVVVFCLCVCVCVCWGGGGRGYCHVYHCEICQMFFNFYIFFFFTVPGVSKINSLT